MDKLDQKILQVLDWDGRTPVTRIAKRVRSNKDVVAYRMRRLEESGVIKRYYPVLDMGKLGYFTSRILLELEEMPREREEELIRFLDKEIGAGLIFRMDYPWRWGIFLWTKSIYEAEKVIVRIKRHLGRLAAGYYFSLICTFRQYPKDYLFGKKYHDTYRSLEPTTPESYDKQDYLILKQLAENARMTTVDIAAKTKIPQTTISNKIKALEKKGIILGYRADIDFTKLGYMNWFMYIYLEDNANLAQIEAWANQHPNVMWLQKIIGMCDIEIEVEVKDRVELEAMLNDLRSRFKNIRRIVFFSQEYRKLTFLP
jgi:Lrp/AsnC family transcriptional regulator, leucine-responsive regulatory protein